MIAGVDVRNVGLNRDEKVLVLNLPPLPRNTVQFAKPVPALPGAEVELGQPAIPAGRGL